MANIRNGLFDAVRRGNIERVIELVDRYGLEYSSAWSDGYNLLREALINKQSTVAKLLINYGSKVNSNTKITDTPLHLAINNGDVEVVNMLLNRNAKIDARGRSDLSPLHIAVDNGNREIIQLLINKRSVMIFCRDGSGMTPFHIAAKLGSVQIVEDFLQSYAYASKNVITVETKDKLTPLYLATENGREQVVKLLLDRGANVNDRNMSGQTILQVAVKKGHLTIVEHILNFRPDVNDKNNRSSLNAAILAPTGPTHEEIVEKLLEYGFTVDAEDAKDHVLLFAAVEKGYKKIVEDLLKFVTNFKTLEKPNSDTGFTMLHSAVKNKQIQVAKLLINSGAEINAKDKTTETPIFYAIQNGHAAMAELLLTNGANIKERPELLILAIMAESKETVEIILKNNTDIDINKTYEYGKTALHYTAPNGNGMHFGAHFYSNDIRNIYNMSEIIKLLLRRKAIVDARDNYGRTTLHFAALQGYSEIIEALFEYHADVNSIDDDGRTPLHLAVEKWNNNRAVEILLKHGADIDIIDKTGKTVLASPKSHIIGTIIERHIIKMEVAKRRVSEENSRSVRDKHSVFRDECNREVEKMINEKFPKSHISFYDILTKGINQLSIYAKNESIAQVLASDCYKEIYPIYFDTIDGEWTRGKKRQRLLKANIILFNFLHGYELPELVLMEVFRYLSDRDLWNLGQAAILNAFE